MRFDVRAYVKRNHLSSFTTSSRAQTRKPYAHSIRFCLIHLLDGFSTRDVDYIWMRDEVIVEQPIMAQFAITTSKVSRKVGVYITGKASNYRENK